MTTSGPAPGPHCLVSVTSPLDVRDARTVILADLCVRKAGGTLAVCFCDDAVSGSAADAAMGSGNVTAEAALNADFDWLNIQLAAPLRRTSARRACYVEYGRRLEDAGRIDWVDGAMVLRPGAGPTVIDDAFGRPLAFAEEDWAPIVVLHADGSPSATFAAALDDALEGTTLAVRAAGGLARIAHEARILAALGFARPRYADAGVLVAGPDDDGLPTVGNLRRAGYLGDAVAAYLAGAGWVPPLSAAGVTRPDLVAAFSLDRLAGGRAVFDPAALRAANSAALHAQAPDQLAALLAAAMQRTGLLENPIPEAARRWVATFLEAFGGEFATLGEALATVADLRSEAVIVPALELERLRNRQVVFFLDAVGQYADAQPELRDLPLAHDLAAIAAEFGIAEGDAVAAVRMALTGKLAGAPLPLLFPLLGHDRILIRIGAISSHLLHGRGLEPIKFGPGGVPFETIAAERPADR